MSQLDRNAPALPSFADESKANLFPFALMCAGWIVPMLKFWAQAWSFVSLPLFVAGVILCALPRWLPASWDRSRGGERRVYEILGVTLFRRIVPNGDWVNAWRRRHDPTFRAIRTRHDLGSLAQRTITGERGHLMLLLAGIASAAFAWSLGWNGWATYLGISNVLANLYPILLQRYTRARLAQIR